MKLSMTGFLTVVVIVKSVVTALVIVHEMFPDALSRIMFRSTTETGRWLTKLVSSKVMVFGACSMREQGLNMM